MLKNVREVHMGPLQRMQKESYKILFIVNSHLFLQILKFNHRNLMLKFVERLCFPNPIFTKRSPESCQALYTPAPNLDDELKQTSLPLNMGNTVHVSTKLRR